MVVSFALFDTLVAVEYPADPADRVAAALRERGVVVPDDWREAYREDHVGAPPGAAVPLPAHVAAALASRDVDAPANVARRAVVSAFDPTVETCEGAIEAVAAAHERGPVGLLSDSRVPELVPRVLLRSKLSRETFDVVVTAAGCGWRKPDRRAFDTVADRLGVRTADLVHVGANPEADGGIVDAGGKFVDASEVPLSDLPERLEALRDA